MPKKEPEGFIPVYVPDVEGNPRLNIGGFKIYNGTMVIKFKDTLPAVAIQRLLDRGELLGVQFVMLESGANKPGMIDPVPNEVSDAVHETDVPKSA